MASSGLGLSRLGKASSTPRQFVSFFLWFLFSGMKYILLILCLPKFTYYLNFGWSNLSGFIKYFWFPVSWESCISFIYPFEKDNSQRASHRGALFLYRLSSTKSETFLIPSIFVLIKSDLSAMICAVEFESTLSNDRWGAQWERI